MKKRSETLTHDGSSPSQPGADVLWRDALGHSSGFDSPGEHDGIEPDPQSINAGDETEESDHHPVPFHAHPRWKAVLAERDQLRQELAQRQIWEPILERLRAEGFGHPDQVQAALAQMEEEYAAQQGHHGHSNPEHDTEQVAHHLNGEVQAGRMTPEYARQMFEHHQHLAQQQHHLNTVSEQMRQAQIHRELQLAQQQHPEIDPQAVHALHVTTGAPISQIAQQAAAHAEALRQQAVSAYIAQQARAGRVPTPEGRGGMVPAATARSTDPSKLPSFSTLFGMRR